MSQIEHRAHQNPRCVCLLFYSLLSYLPRGPQEKMTGEVEAVPTDKASRIKARKASMTAGDPFSERKGTREGPGRSFRTPSAEVQQYTTWNMDMNMDMDMDMEDGMHMCVL